ncbi:MAG TPA: hypothetical protein VL337_14250 [Acidimicrobiales bacterium]|nr:hypothetical protein [Acidimicrobiales bacterium]
MSGFEPTCPPVHRPELLLDPATPVAGLRAAQGRRAAGPVYFCDVWLFQDPPPALADAARWTVTAPPGARAVSVAAATIEPLPTPHVSLALGGEPDVARYRVAVDPEATPAVAFDPLRTWLLARLRPDCPDLGSCFDPPPAAPAPAAAPAFDPLARDFRSLRRALLEYARRADPDVDLSIATPTAALVELFAHAGDVLNYRLDRVATEAYLETARLRTSVRRHARLVDFRVNDGASARTFVHLSVPPTAAAPVVPVRAGDVAVDLPGSPLAFTLEADVTARAALGEIPLYDWSEDACCLPAGATSCVLVRPQPADPLGAGWLGAGDRLVFEVVDAGDLDGHRRWSRRDPAQPWPAAGPGGAPTFRAPRASRPAQVVELVAVAPVADPLAPPGMVLTRVWWRAEDALRRSYPVGVDTGGGAPEVVVARACVVPAHHGRVVDGPAGTTVTPRASELAAPSDPTSAWWLTGCGTLRDGGPGLSRDRDGFPTLLEVQAVLPSTVVAGVDILPSLLDAAPGTLAAVVDTEVHEPPVLRFRTGALGAAPPAGTELLARYEVGAGALGNLPANALGILERDANAGTALRTPDFSPFDPAVVVARNPVPAVGGADPDPLGPVRRDAPQAFAAVPRRAVLPADLAAAARRQPGIRQATARRIWAGSWPLVEVVVDLDVDDPAGPPGQGARDAVQAALDDLRMVGTEVAVVAGRGVGLYVAVEVCVLPGIDPGEARGRVLQVLRPGSDARPGLFHPSRLEMGAAVYCSAVVAAVAALDGVDAAEVIEARRLAEPPGTLHQVLTFAPDEIGLLDDDPDRPDRGRLDVVVRGGR